MINCTCRTPPTSKWKSVVAEYTGNDIEISFVPVFKIVHDDTVPAYSNFGISVDKKTGRVSVDNTWTSDGSPHNFILEAFISDNGNGIPWIKIASAVVRIHVHLSVASIRLTPSLLSLRRQKPSGQAEDAGPQFAVRAEFDDGTTGDISYSDDLTFTPATWFQGRLIRIPASAANTVAPFAVTVTASAKWNSKSAQAQLEVLQPWATEPNVPTADLLDGQPGVWDGTIKPETVPNIIFLGCGFTAASQAMFRMVADTIVHKLKTDRLLQPYGYLATSMNYWSVMVPAPDAGVSVRSEVQQLTESGQLFAQLVPTPVEAPPASTDWDLQHLIYAAGLPVPADLKLVRQVDPNQQGQPPQPIATLDALRALPLNQLDFQLLFNRWAAIMRLDDPVNMIAALSRSVVQQWIALADRAFIDEVNGFPAVSVGAPPMAGINDTGLLALHDLRGEQSAPITAFFQRVTATPRNGVTVTLDDTGAAQPGLGYLWAEDRAGFAFDNRSFVVALNNSTDGRARIAEPGVQTSLNLSGVGPDGKTFPMRPHLGRAAARCGRRCDARTNHAGRHRQRTATVHRNRPVRQRLDAICVADPDPRSGCDRLVVRRTDPRPHRRVPRRRCDRYPRQPRLVGPAGSGTAPARRTADQRCRHPLVRGLGRLGRGRDPATPGLRLRRRDH